MDHVSVAAVVAFLVALAVAFTLIFSGSREKSTRKGQRRPPSN